MACDGPGFGEFASHLSCYHAAAMTAIQTEHPERPDPTGADWADHCPDHLTRYLHAAEYVKGKRVLDAGTGPGYGAVVLHEAGARHVQAVDIDPPTIEAARKRYGTPGLDFRVDDCHTLATVTGPFDVVCSFENIEHLPEPKRFLAAVVRRMSPDGVMFCSSPDRADPFNKWVNGRPANPYHFHEWYEPEFTELLAPYFDEVEILHQVMSHTAMARRKAVENLEEHVAYLWRNPVQRAARAVSKVLGHPQPWPPFARLATPSPGDFPIVSGRLAPIRGYPHVLVAVCRGPKVA